MSVIFFSLTLLLFFSPLNLRGSEIKLIENVPKITLTKDLKYNALDHLKAVGNCTLEWKLSSCLDHEYGISIHTKDTSVRLSSNTGNEIDVILFDGRNSSVPITLFDLNNLQESMISVFVELNATVLRFPLQMQISAKQMIAPGLYQCFLDVAVYSINGREIETQTIQLILEILPFQTLTVKFNPKTASENIHEVDFGNICEKTTKTVILEVLSNIPYQVFAHSVNGGKLLLEPYWDKGHYECRDIPYDCSCSCKKIYLESTPKLISSGLSAMGNSPQCHEFSMTIFPDLSKNWEGVYKDEIVFSIQPSF